MPDATVILALKLLPGMGNVSINRLTAWVRATDRALEDLAGRPLQELLTLVPNDLARCAESLSDCSGALLSRASNLIQRFEYTGGQVVLASDGDYPASLRAGLADAAPPLIFVSGELDALSGDCAAVAGTRNPSDMGISLARTCARAFAEENIAVVSGGAAGIDTTAHAAAIEAGGRTVVVLPEGLLSYRGPSELLEGVEEGSVVLVSEFEPNAVWSIPRALARNATLVALSRVVCVIEPGATGGSIRTAQHALEQGKPLLVSANQETDSVIKRLEQRGALRLSGDNGDFDRDRLLDAWAEAADSGASQSELF